jgi:hypothetical protein
MFVGIAIALAITCVGIACAITIETCSLAPGLAIRRSRQARGNRKLDHVVEELATLGFANMDDYVSLTSGGEPFVDLSKLSRHQMAAIQEVTVEDFTDGRGPDVRKVRRVKLKLHDKRGPLVDLGKHFGGFVNRTELTGRDGGPVEHAAVTVAAIGVVEAARRIAFAFSRAARVQDQAQQLDVIPTQIVPAVAVAQTPAERSPAPVAEPVRYKTPLAELDPGTGPVTIGVSRFASTAKADDGWPSRVRVLSHSATGTTPRGSPGRRWPREPSWRSATQGNSPASRRGQ